MFCLLTRTQNLNLEVINGDPKGGVGGTEEGPRRALEKCHKRGEKWGWPLRGRTPPPPRGGVYITPAEVSPGPFPPFPSRRTPGILSGGRTPPHGEGGVWPAGYDYGKIKKIKKQKHFH